MKEITVQELKAKKEAGDEFILLDVREPFEYDVSNLGGELVPLGQLQKWLEENEDKKDTEIVMMCRSGARSGRATSQMSQICFTNVANLKGGITAWAREIDTNVPVA